MNDFISRHIPHNSEEIKEMLNVIGVSTLDELIDKIVPENIRLKDPLNLPESISEEEYLRKMKEIASMNKIYKSYIGMGFYDTITPLAIRKNILENPSWYTSYTPYQAEISQGRLEALFLFQTVICELTGMEIANASMLDDATSAAEAMYMFFNYCKSNNRNCNYFFIDNRVFPQVKAVVETRAKALNINVVYGFFENFVFNDNFFGALVQYPDDNGEINDYTDFIDRAHNKNVFVVVYSDLLALTLLKTPGEMNADAVVGSAQRFGIPMGYGGPAPGFFATRELFKRYIPGRIIGLSKTKSGRNAYRMALQMREQHIKREKATSNICTSQVLTAIIAAMYAVYHGSEGLKNIATRIHSLACFLDENIRKLGFIQKNRNFFDTIKILIPENINVDIIKNLSEERKANLRYFSDGSIGISINETTTFDDINELIEIFEYSVKKPIKEKSNYIEQIKIEQRLLRNTKYLQQNVFNKYKAEISLMRYIKKLENRDFSLTNSMIPLGSCTMKMTEAILMMFLTWDEFSKIHPFVPIEQAAGYQKLMYELGIYFKNITGLSEVSFQPTSGASGEYTGLLIIKKYLQNIGEIHRDIVFIPASAHGTNPASATMAGLKTVVIECDENGSISKNDLLNKLNEYGQNLAAIMITYPSTHGVFEDNIIEITELVHKFGGQVYMDGANLNALMGLTSPAKIGADVCHLNLHKTFAMPHGGGGPGAGAILVADHLVEFLPDHPIVPCGGVKSCGTVSSSPFGNASLLTISHAFCHLLGREGLIYTSKIALLNANYLMKKLETYYEILYKGTNGYVAHEMIVDFRNIKNKTKVNEIDVAKRLMDYGFHAPTLSFPVHGTLMIEPTESEPKEEIDRFIDAMLSIRNEIKEIEETGNFENNVLKNSPHTQNLIIKDYWDLPYSRKKAAFPVPYLYENKIWPFVDRIDDAYGDRNLICKL